MCSIINCAFASALIYNGFKTSMINPIIQIIIIIEIINRYFLFPVFCSISFLGGLVLDFFVFKADYYVLSDDTDIFVSDRDWNRHYMAVSKTKEINLELSASFNTEANKVTSAQIIEASSTYEDAI